MTTRLVVLAALVAVLALTGVGPRAALGGGVTYNVSRTDDPAADGCQPDDCSLREAVIAANESPGEDEVLPAGTQSFFLAFLDLDADDFVHWLLYDIPADTMELAAGADPPGDADEGMTSFGGTDYGGPCPPAEDEPHEYMFTLYALDTVLGLGPGATAQELTDAMDGHVLGMAQLSGFFDRQALQQ